MRRTKRDQSLTTTTMNAITFHRFPLLLLLHGSELILVEDCTLIRINELNKLSEKFISEQKKYINYFRIKKQYGKTKESEFLELLNKKGNELASLDKLDMPIYSKNIFNMTERIKTITDKMNLKNSFSVNI